MVAEEIARGVFEWIVWPEDDLDAVWRGGAATLGLAIRQATAAATLLATRQAAARFDRLVALGAADAGFGRTGTVPDAA